MSLSLASFVTFFLSESLTGENEYEYHKTNNHRLVWNILLNEVSCVDLFLFQYNRKKKNSVMVIKE